MARAVLHIGTEKTGTTTLQKHLLLNDAALAKGRWRYPYLGGGPAHTALAVCAADSDADVFDLDGLSGRVPGEERSAFVARIDAALSAEVRAHPKARFLLSTEHAHSRLVSDHAVDRLKTMLKRHFSTVDVIVYLRRWDRAAVAAHATAVVNGAVEAFDFADYLGKPYLDYSSLLDRWARAFGDKRLRVAVFDRAELKGGSIVDDFVHRLRLPALAPVGDTNVSPPSATIELIRRINPQLSLQSPRTAAMVREALATDAPRLLTRTPMLPSRTAARRFVRLHKRQAEIVRQRFLPDRATVFDDDFGSYPKEEAAFILSPDVLAATMAAALSGVVERSRMIAGELHYYRARMHLDHGRPALARDEIDSALLAAPGDAAHHHVSALVDIALGRVDQAKHAIDVAIAIDPDNMAHHAVAARIIGHAPGLQPVAEVASKPQWPNKLPSKRSRRS